jgi:hypothetical protein
MSPHIAHRLGGRDPTLDDSGPAHADSRSIHAGEASLSLSCPCQEEVVLPTSLADSALLRYGATRRCPLTLSMNNLFMAAKTLPSANARLRVIALVLGHAVCRQTTPAVPGGVVQRLQ